MSEFYKQSATQVLAAMEVNEEQGLSKEAVVERQLKYGKNELPAGEQTSFLTLLIGQFKDLMVIVLIFAAFISILLGEITDSIVILIIVVLNASLGVYQERQAEQALAALSKMQIPLVTVRRNGAVTQVSASEIVPGDIVLLDEGNAIPADGRVIEASNLRVEEAALTGESVPVDKDIKVIDSDSKMSIGDRTNMLYRGTNISYGRGEMVVTATGLKTEIGNIASLLMQVEEGTTPLQRRLDQLGKILATAAFIIVAIVFFIGWVIRGIPAEEMFLTAVSLAVAAVPEGLPALVTIGLSLGASKMAERHALIRRLPAVETLGSVTVICSDKTGTLTKNEMTATYLVLPGHENLNVTGIGYNPQGDFINEDTGAKMDPREDPEVSRFLKAMALSTNAYLENVTHENYTVVGDTTEGAMLVATKKVGWSREQLEIDFPRMAELPFSSERKAMTTIHEVAGEEARTLFPNTRYIAITKGAPDRLLAWATEEHKPEGSVEFIGDRRERWEQRIDQMASQGLRVLGIAYKPLNEVPEKIDESLERNLRMIGLIGILDPARPEAREAVQVAKRAGIRSIMITGDHSLTAQAIATDLGIIDQGDPVITGHQLDEMSDAQIAKALETTSCFARVSPQHKLQLVKILQSSGQIAAMTGDGVNDAPALKQADIGVAMGITGTDVSKGAADMVLADDNFASIVAAVEEGRVVYENIRKFIKYLLSSNVGEILVMFSALLIGLKVPLLAIQILWINLVTDGLPAIALGFEPAEEGIMERKPRPLKESIFAKGVGRHIIWVGILIGILTLGGYIWGHTSYGMDAFSPTLGLENFTEAELINLVGSRSITDEGGEELIIVPDDWDNMTEQERINHISNKTSDDSAPHEELSYGLIGEAERIPRTIAFTILAFTQMFEVMGIHSGDHVSFFRKWFKGNMLLLWAVLGTFVLQLIVVYVPFMQDLFYTSPLSALELFVCFLVGGLILVAVEIEKLLIQKESQ